MVASDWEALPVLIHPRGCWFNKALRGRGPTGFLSHIPIGERLAGGCFPKPMTLALLFTFFFLFFLPDEHLDRTLGDSLIRVESSSSAVFDPDGGANASHSDATYERMTYADFLGRVRRWWCCFATCCSSLNPPSSPCLCSVAIARGAGSGTCTGQRRRFADC